MLLTNCKYLVTQNADRDVLEDVDVLIQENKIAAIGRDLAKKHAKEEQLDCSERIVMPGLVNCHAHLGMSAMRGLSDDKELDAWLKDIIDAEKKVTRQVAFEGAMIGMREALRTGTTTICDHYWEREGSLLAARSLGIRLLYFPDFFSAHDYLSKDIAVLMPKVKDLPATITIGLAPHSIYGTNEKFLRKARAYATKNKMLLHIHVAETRKERVDCKEEHGKLPVEYLDSIGFLGPDVIIAHAVWLTKGELDILAKHNVKVVHCPQSNMKLAGGGVMPLREMQERGIIVALGTDSTASNNSLDMFREMHIAALLHKHHHWDPAAADAQTVLDMATVNGAKILGKDVGSIEVGKLADIIMLDAEAVNLQPLKRDRIISHIVYAASGLNVSDVIVDGTLLVQGNRLL